MRTDKNGNFVYSVVVWSDLKKSLKSICASVRALYTAYANEWATVYVIANDLKQADSRVAYYIRRAIELNPRMKAECRINRYLVELPNHSRIEAIPVDPTGEAGGNADLLVFSELWGWKHESHIRMWTEQTLSPTKFGKSQRWAEGYAGYVGESPILEGLFDTAVKNGEQITDDLELYRNGSILALWNTRPRLEWQTPEYYASEAAILHPSEYSRIHENKWAQSSQSFVPAEWWDACAGEYPAFAQWTPVVIAIDAAVSSDCFAMIVVSRYEGKTFPREIHLWKAPKGGQIQFSEPMAMLRSICQRYNVENCTYDPFQMEMFQQQVTDIGFVFMKPFGQGAPRLEADKALYDSIRERTLVHDGNLDLREHILNANAEIDKQEHKLRLVKRTETAKIDLAVCLSMAAYTANELQL